MAFSSCDILESDVRLKEWSDGKPLLPPDDSMIADSIRSIYREDAARLALRDLQKDSVAKNTKIEIPEEQIQLYYAGLIRVYRATTLIERDSVVAIFKIHTFPYPEMRSLLVAVDSSKEWTRAWRNGQRLTGNPQIDELMERYALEFDRYYSWPNLQLTVIRSPKPLNIFALGRSFAKVSGVVYAEPNGVCCDGNNITASIESELLKYVFSLGYGDCPAGCISRRYWEFHVGYDGSVKFARSYGSPPPLRWN